MLRWAVLINAAAAATYADDPGCGCHNLNSDWGTKKMFERGYAASLKHRADDLKELRERSKQTLSAKELKKAMSEELWASLRRYRNAPITSTKEAEAEAEVIKVLGEKMANRDVVLVLNNRVYVHREFYDRSKQPGHAVMVREAAQLLGVPHVIYDFASETAGAAGCNKRPIKLSINKELGYDQCGIMVPNSYFGNGNGNLTLWGNENREQDAKLIPFAKRVPKALYRGSLHPDPENLFTNREACSRVAFGNYARIQAFASSFDHPHEVDAKCTTGHNGSCILPPPSCIGIVEDFNSGLKNKTDVGGKYLDDEHYRNHKYLLNLPGAASGSYSKNLNHLWRTGAVVMQWVHPFVEWYHPALQHGRTHLDVSRFSVAEYVKALEADPATAQRLGANARFVHDTLLCPKCLAEFLKETFEALNTHLGQHLILDDGRRLSKLLREHGDCATWAEVDQFKGHNTLPRLLAEDDPIHPCRKGGPIANKNWQRDHDAMVQRLKQAQAVGIEKRR